MRITSKLAIYFFLLAIPFLFISACEMECLDGFSGKDCEVMASDQFVGSYEGFVNCGFQNEYATLEINKKQDPFDIIINITSSPDFIFEANINGDSIFIPDQWLGLTQGNETSYFIIFQTAGILKGDTLRFPLTLLAAGITNPQQISCQYEIIK